VNPNGIPSQSPVVVPPTSGTTLGTRDIPTIIYPNGVASKNAQYNRQNENGDW